MELIEDGCMFKVILLFKAIWLDEALHGCMHVTLMHVTGMVDRCLIKCYILSLLYMMRSMHLQAHAVINPHLLIVIQTELSKKFECATM